MAVEWFYLRDGQIVGPLTAAQVREHALAQKVGLVDHVRRGGDCNWVPASKVKGLFDPPPAAEQPAELQPTPPRGAPVVASNPNLTDCPDCGKSVSRQAKQCPHCGRPLGTPVGKLVIVRLSAMTGSMYAVRVTVGGELFGEVKNGGQVTVELPDGKHKVKVAGGGLSNSAVVNIVGAKTTRFQMYFSEWGIFGGGLNFKPA